MEKKLFDAYEQAFYAQSPLPQAGSAGKLWAVVSGLWTKGLNPLVIFGLIQQIMAIIQQFNTLSVEELIQKVLALLTPAVS